MAFPWHQEEKTSNLTLESPEVPKQSKSASYRGTNDR